MKRRLLLLSWLLWLALVLVACGPDEAALQATVDSLVATQVRGTAEARPLPTGYPTHTPYPSQTPWPTATPRPPATPYATEPPLPTATPYPTLTPTASATPGT